MSGFGRRVRGVGTVTDRMRAAHRQLREGASKADLARLYDVGVKTITEWVAKAQDELNLSDQRVENGR